MSSVIHFVLRVTADVYRENALKDLLKSSGLFIFFWTVCLK
ncbi:hypothetical protein EV701_11084 [Chthoniobacter flavus]|nr:hypothetical protein EV701_11084 [Chthoniobacter flavus]